MGINEVKLEIKRTEYLILTGDIMNSNTVMYYLCLCGYYTSIGGKENIVSRMEKKGIFNLIRNNKDNIEFRKSAIEYYNRACTYFKTGMCTCGNKQFILSCLRVNNLIFVYKTKKDKVTYI